jgi:putative oxidoreductase
MKKYVPSLVWYGPFESFAYAFIRFCTGAVLLAHGVGRLFYGVSVAEFGGALGGLSASAVGWLELVAGALLALGLLTRPVALLFGIEWLIIAFAQPLRPGQSWFMLGATPHYPAMIVSFCLAFLFRGGGYYSLDRVIGKEF